MSELDRQRYDQMLRELRHSAERIHTETPLDKMQRHILPWALLFFGLATAATFIRLVVV